MDQNFDIGKWIIDRWTLVSGNGVMLYFRYDIYNNEMIWERQLIQEYLKLERNWIQRILLKVCMIARISNELLRGLVILKQKKFGIGGHKLSS